MYILCIVPFHRQRGRAHQPLPGRCSVEEELDEIQCTQHDKATESKIKKFTFILRQDLISKFITIPLILSVKN